MNAEWKFLMDMYMKRKKGEEIVNIAVEEIIHGDNHGHVLIFDLDKKIYTQFDGLLYEPFLHDENVPRNWSDYRFISSIN